jgi:hypothetical protein
MLGLAGEAAAPGAPVGVPGNAATHRQLDAADLGQQCLAGHPIAALPDPRPAGSCFSVGSARGAVPALLPVRFRRPPSRTGRAVG